MMNKIFSLVLVMVFVFGGLGFSLNNAEAQGVFPAGCSSGLGYSVTTGLPCNGTSTATAGPLAGCTTALGYSVTTGVACSGTGVGITFLAGCTSTSGFSTITSAPCNGTTVANSTPVVPVDPGLPVTGVQPINMAIAVFTGLVAAALAFYLSRRFVLAK